jgi:hypothetical protein
MRRAAELEARRRALLARADAQRAELAARVAELRHGPFRWSRPLAAAVQIAGAAPAVRHPLAWLTAVVSLMLLGRTREVLAVVVWARSLLALLSRATEVASLIGSLRRIR